jgi:hypothetical protein
VVRHEGFFACRSSKESVLGLGFFTNPLIFTGKGIKTP